ncbi:MAG TPA: ROK family transcriptional regulator [Spirochaetes bacterium]|nr:ROK family transcriptional regulator [Spirochaetota bacterium]
MRVRTGDPEMAREINRALILHLLRRHDSIPRAEIARHLNLSKVTVSTIVSGLLKNGHVVELGEGAALEKGGRRPIMLSLNIFSKYVIGIDIGTTNTVAAVGNLKGTVLKKISVTTTRNHSVENILGQVSHLVDEIIIQSEVDKKRIIGVGLSVAGQIEKDSGLIIFSPHFNWRNVYIAKLVEDKTGFKTIADNCTRAMALGEVWFGNGKNVSNLLFINVGYGIGSALVLDGKIYNHHSEFGHTFITKKKIHCPCGKYGCIEVVASGNAIERQANKLMDTENNEWISVKMAAERAEKGDTVAKKIIYEAGRYLGRGISILANFITPEKIIIGGGVSSAGDLLLKPILSEFNKNTMEVVKAKTQVCISSLGMEAGVYGAIAMALNDMFFNYGLVNQQLLSNRLEL